MVQSPSGPIQRREVRDHQAVAEDRRHDGDRAIGTGLSDELVLRPFNVGPDALLGRGGEASIYALDADRVLRVLHPGGDVQQLRRNQALLTHLTVPGTTFQLPQILEVGEVEGRVYAIERRLPGRPLAELLPTVHGPQRVRLVEAYLEAANRLGDLRPEGWTYFGELAAERPVRAATWKQFLLLKARQSLAIAGPPLDRVDPSALAGDLPEPDRSLFVHLDAFPENMLTDGVRITAVLDVGHTCLAGDRQLDPLAAAVYLEPPTSAFATVRDHEIARSWLRSAGLLHLLEPVRRWLAAYWAFAVDEVALQDWCRTVLESA
jgi:aminoglycoside phosphotransferase (APT) family kinase protein